MYVLDQHFENYGAAFIRHDNVDFVLTPLQCGIFWDVISVVSRKLGPLHSRVWCQKREGVYLLDPPKFIESSKIPFGPPTKAAVVVNFKDQGWDLDV